MQWTSPELHPNCEFTFLVQGEGRLHIRNESVLHSAGSLFLAGPGVPHWFEPTHYPCEYLAIHFLPRLLLEMAPGTEGIQFLQRFSQANPIHHRAFATRGPLRKLMHDRFREFQTEFSGNSHAINETWLVASGGPWKENGPNSKWISIHPEQGGDILPGPGNLNGFFVFTTEFNLSGYDPSTASIQGQFLADNYLHALLFNDQPIQFNTSTEPLANHFVNWNAFVLTNGFLPETNRLTFVVRNGIGFLGDPMALRVEIQSRVCRPAGSSPEIDRQPADRLAAVGEPVELSVLVECGDPSYQWIRDGVPLTGATNSAYSIAAASLEDAGTYEVEVRNSGGVVLSRKAVLQVGHLQPRLSLILGETPSLVLHGLKTRTYRIEISDLPEPSSSWEPWMEFQLENETYEFSDPFWGSLEQRFYRAVYVPPYPEP